MVVVAYKVVVRMAVTIRRQKSKRDNGTRSAKLPTLNHGKRKARTRTVRREYGSDRHLFSNRSRMVLHGLSATVLRRWERAE